MLCRYIRHAGVVDFLGDASEVRNMITNAEAEAIRIFYGLSTRQSAASTAREFGVHPNSVRAVMHGKTHAGKPRGCFRGKRPGQISIIGREKRIIILESLRSGPKEVGELRSAIGGSPDRYLTEMRKAGKIERKFVWVLK